jgi:hypothetical protein
MRPRALFLLLLYLLLWGCGPELAAAWLPVKGERGAGGDIYPMALRYREQLRRQMQPPGTPRGPRLRPAHERPVPAEAPCRVAGQPSGAERRYLLMSLLR